MNISIFDADKIRREANARFGTSLQVHDPCGGNLYFTVDEPNEDAAAYVGEEFAKLGLTMEVQEGGRLLSFRKA